jgi:hypothetical protein
MKAPPLTRLEPPNGYPEAELEEQRLPNSAWHGFLLSLILQSLRWFFRDAERVCVEIVAVDGRFPNEVLGLYLEQDEDALRFWGPATSAWVPTDAERANKATAHAEAAEKHILEVEAELARRDGKTE